MSNTINDGGPAYLWTEFDQAGSLHQQHPGMTLRDYFAAKAMQAAMHGAHLGGMPGKDEQATKLAAMAARGSYAIADQMLKARGAA